MARRSLAVNVTPHNLQATSNSARS
jgi:hypothetical protein